MRRVLHLCSNGDIFTFSNAIGAFQGNFGHISVVHYRGGGRAGRVQPFIITAARAVNAERDRLIALRIRVVAARIDRHRATAFAHRDGDLRAVAQGDQQRATGYRGPHRHSHGKLPAFVHRRLRAQGDFGHIPVVYHNGCCRTT